MKRRGGGLLVLQREYGGCRSSAAGEFFLGIPDRPGLVSCSLPAWSKEPEPPSPPAPRFII